MSNNWKYLDPTQIDNWMCYEFEMLSYVMDAYEQGHYDKVWAYKSALNKLLECIEETNEYKQRLQRIDKLNTLIDYVNNQFDNNTIINGVKLLLDNDEVTIDENDPRVQLCIVVPENIHKWFEHKNKKFGYMLLAYSHMNYEQVWSYCLGIERLMKTIELAMKTTTDNLNKEKLIPLKNIVNKLLVKINKQFDRKMLVSECKKAIKKIESYDMSNMPNMEQSSDKIDKNDIKDEEVLTKYYKYKNKYMSLKNK